MRPLVLVTALSLLVGCASGTVQPFGSGVYEAVDQPIWLQLRVEEGLAVFYDAEGASVDAGGDVQGTELHRDELDLLIQEERGEACGDDLWYDAAMLDGMVSFELNGVWFSWPTLVQVCDSGDLILSDDEAAMDCDGDEPCLYFVPVD
jgi:hypothetical protein